MGDATTGMAEDQTNGRFFIFQCNSYNFEQLPTLSLLIGNNWFEVRSDDYVKRIVGSNLCTVCINPNRLEESWNLGITFLKDWYVTHSVKR